MKRLRDTFWLGIGLATVWLTALGSGATALAQQVLVVRGEATARIVLANDAIPAEKTAAKQLQHYLREMTGAEIPLIDEEELAVSSEDATQSPYLFIGLGRRAKALLSKETLEGIGKDGIVLQSVGKDLVLAGDRPRGTLYAVYEFLETLGCRWWTPTERYLPKHRTLEVPFYAKSYTPPFFYREHFASAMRQHAEFSVIMRENGNFQLQGPEWGGHYEILGFVHTFAKLLPVARHFKDHPEWYSDPSNGYRPATSKSRMPMPQHTQLCLSNPEVLQAVTEKALEWIRGNPSAGIISISQNDSSGYCRCAKCEAVTQAEQSPSGPLLKFVNAVAEEIGKLYPGFWVETLAYNFSEKPPKTIRPSKNVLIRLGSPTADVAHPLDSDWNKKARRNFRAWSKVSDQLFIWTYATNFKHTMLPHPNWGPLADDLRFAAELGTRGVFVQGDGYTDGVGDFHQLRTWLMGRLLWDPSLDQTTLENEFLVGYYGAAAPHLRRYLDGLQATFLATGKPLETFNTDLSFLTPKVLQRLRAAFDDAAKAVEGDRVLADRVRRERLSLDLAALYEYQRLRHQAGGLSSEELEEMGIDDPRAFVEELIASARRFGIRNYSEHDRFADRVPHLRAIVAPSVPLPEFLSHTEPDDVIDFQPGHFSLHDRGRYSQLEKDAQASAGTAATIIGDSHQWAIQMPLQQYLGEDADDSWQVYAYCRITRTSASPEGNVAFQCGIFDYPNRHRVIEHQVPMDQMADETYQRIDLGRHRLTPGMYIWFASVHHPGVKKLYVDRIILQRR